MSANSRLNKKLDNIAKRHGLTQEIILNKKLKEDLDDFKKEIDKMADVVAATYGVPKHYLFGSLS